MLQDIQTTARIRQRGQITLPNVIRKTRDWVSTDSVVVISAPEPDRILIQPFSPKKSQDWEKMWNLLKKARSLKGRGRVGSLSRFIVKDRETHF